MNMLHDLLPEFGAPASRHYFATRLAGICFDPYCKHHHFLSLQSYHVASSFTPFPAAALTAPPHSTTASPHVAKSGAFTTRATSHHVPSGVSVARHTLALSIFIPHIASKKLLCPTATIRVSGWFRKCATNMFTRGRIKLRCTCSLTDRS